MDETSVTRPILGVTIKSLVVVLGLFASIHSSEAFQPLPFMGQLQHSTAAARVRFLNDRVSTMRYQSPWDLAVNSASRRTQTDVSSRFTSGGGSCLESLPFSLPGIFENSIRIGDPEVSETQAGYTLTFKLPAEVKEDDLHVSISGRILTMEARVTREVETDGEAQGGIGGDWVGRSHSTHSCARSFVLPSGVSANDVKARWVGDGALEIMLEKGYAAADVSTVLADATAAVPVECKDDKVTPTSAVDDYLSRLKAVNPRGGNRSSRLDPWAELTGGNLLPTLDDDFRNFGKSVFNHYGLRFPTEEQVAATVAKAREERARRVTAIKRETMATDVSENELSYIVRFALPNGATRDNVKLTVTPDRAIRVNFSPHGRRSVSKYVRLPWDANLSDVISARFEEDESIDNGGKEGSPVEGGVSNLRVTVGRKAPSSPHPKIIDIE